jgi:hypothetical protein
MLEYAMYRLVRVHLDNGTPSVHVERDGYTSVAAAWTAYLRAPDTITGIGHLDADGRLLEVIVDPARPGHVDPAVLNELADALEVRIRSLADECWEATRTVDTLSDRIRKELADHVADEAWRAPICAALARQPLAIGGLIDAVRSLTYSQVLDLFPALQHLASELPASIRKHLRDSIQSRRSVAAVAALRLGLAA